MLKNRISYIVLFIFVANYLFSQTTSTTSNVVGMVVDSNQYAIPYSTVQFLNKDSVIKYGSMCDEIGLFKLDSVLAGKYIIKISSVGYTSKYNNLLVKKDEPRTRISPIVLYADIYQIGEIEISANETGYISYVDKSVFYPDSSSIKSSKNALDLINKVPEIKVSKQDDIIKVLGNSNVLVLINGVQNNRVLKAIKPSDVERVEVITHPSAKYRSDIASVVNIILKDKRTQGINVYSDVSLCLNEKNHLAFTQVSYTFKKLRFFFNYNAFLSKSISKDSTIRNEGINSYYTHSLDNSSFDWNSQSFQYGLDFTPNKTLSINFTGKFNYRKTISNDVQKSLYTQNDTSIIDEMLSYNDIINNHLQQNYSLYIKKDINKNNTLTLSSNFYILNQTITSDIKNTHINTSSIDDIYLRTEKSKMEQFAVNSKIDYTHIVNKKITMETGYQFYSREINTEVNDKLNISKLKYIDFRNSIYANSIFKLNKNGIQVGLRAENLNIELYDTVKNNYTKVLPNISFNHKFNNSKNFRVSYNQRFKYPSYYQLNPYTYYSSDSISTSSGNPNLTPEISHNINTQFSLRKKKVNSLISFGYRNINNLIVQNLQTTNGLVESKYRNMGNAEKYISRFNISTQFFKTIEFQVYIGVVYNLFKDRAEYNGFSYTSEIELYTPLFWDIELDVAIVLYSKEITYNGYEEINTMIDEISISKYIFNDNFIIGFSVWEPFFKATGHEKQWTDTYSEIAYYETINNTCYMFNLTFMLDKGRKAKKIKTELNMEDNYQ